MTSRSVLTCPVCGAPRNPGSARCEYCGSWLLVFPDQGSDRTPDEAVIREQAERFRTVLAKNPDDVVALHGLGVAYRNLGLLDDAIKVLARAANRRPDALGIQRALAGTLYDAVREQSRESRMWRDVGRQADRIIALDADSIEGWWLRAEVALQTGDDDGLVAAVHHLAQVDSDGVHRRFAARLRNLGERRFHDWRWQGAVDAWTALAAIDPVAGRTALANFLLQNARLVPRSSSNVWQAVRRTMALRGDFRLSTLAALALGVAIALVVAIVTLAVAREAFQAVAVIGLIIWPVLTVVAVRFWLMGWPPFLIPARPWATVTTAEMVRVAQAIAPLINRIRPGG